MTFSVLLPTHDRLDLLRNAVETVLRQDYQDWEVVVSDNASGEDVEGYVAQLGDARVRYVRTPAFLPVTDSWNYALQAARGDYVLMLGDDDGLLPGYFRSLREVVEGHDRPDLVYHSALLLAYPGVLPDRPEGFLQDYTGTGFVRRAPSAYPLAPADARDLVRKAMRFQMALGYNMQFSLVSRRLVERMEAAGPFFQSAFPDYYATLAMLLEAESIIVDPRPRVVIGISPKSYGFFHFNNREEEGKRFLAGEGAAGDSEARSLELPGTNINTGWLDAVRALEKRYGAKHGIRVALWRYRFIQTTSVYVGHYITRTLTGADLRDLQLRLTKGERAVADLGMVAYGIGHRALRVLRSLGVRPPMTRTRELLGQSPGWAGAEVPTVFRDVVEVFEAVEAAASDDPAELAALGQDAA
jgi:glycosyltransferase involved in cell wall biosynthesis